MSLSRRMFLGRAASTAAAAGAFSLPTLLSAPAFAQNGSAPQTPFEAGGRTGWTSHAAELDFFDSILGSRSPNRFTMDVIGETDLDDCVRRDGSEGTLPVHLFAFGTDDTGDVATPGTRPTVYILCSQHGNEPAGREAGIELIRDLAFTTDPTLLELLSKVNIIVTPTANPRGRQRNARENGVTDINRDHLNLRTREARAYAEAGNLWRPYMIVDHHEYGPGQPVLYDDDVLYLWPRNLNVDEQVRAGAKAFCLDYVKADCEAAGYTADEYGLAKVGPNYGPLQTPVGAPTGAQTAGDWDDGTFVDDDEYVEYVVSWEDPVTEPMSDDPARSAAPDSATAEPEWRNIFHLLLEEPPSEPEPNGYAHNGFHEAEDQPGTRGGRHAREQD